MMNDRAAALATAALLAVTMTSCGGQRPPPLSPAAVAAKQEVVSAPADPYPSTYRPWPSRVTVIRGATIYDGEGRRIDNGTIRLANGKVEAIGGPDLPVPADDAVVIDGRGKWVTPGIIDIHSHLGDYPSPAVAANADENEMSGPLNAGVWAEHSVWPQDPGFTRALVNGGITTLQVLPGSANLFGGRSVVLKNVPGRTVQEMKFPGAPYGLKMACGENPKRVYGAKGRMPTTRMGNVALARQGWADAQNYLRKWDDYERKARDGRAKPADAPKRDMGLETMAAALRGEILVQDHCYRADEMAIVIDMAKEFGYKVAAFHHAVEAYKIADLLRENHICAAMWADWWGFKMESYDAIPENIGLVQNAGACAIVHSDDENVIQRLNQEAAKALAASRRAGIAIAPEVAWTWLAINPARAIGVDQQTGSLKPGKMADVVLWNGDPFSVYTRPEKIWIDGAMMYDMADPKMRPVSDFELGQPGEGDVK